MWLISSRILNKYSKIEKLLLIVRRETRHDPNTEFNEQVVSPRIPSIASKPREIPK